MGASDKSGQVLDDRYQLIRLLGEGGMGAVYLGMHLKLGRDVAVKLLHGQLAGNEDVVKRFYREAQTAAAINHLNIIDVLDVGTAPWGDPYLVMEFLEGENLADLLARLGPLDLPSACGVLAPVLLALSAAHEIGIVHRDLKPENIFITRRRGEPPQIKLIDFGISKFVGGGDKTRLTQTGFMLGTPAYMSPEQARGRTDVDHQSDVYSCGVILYEMLAGDLPFIGQNYNELLVNILSTEPRSPTEVRESFPVEAVAVVIRALAKEPEDRFATAADMLAALEALPGYEQRKASLKKLPAPPSNLAYATGDLGDTIALSTPPAWTPPTEGPSGRRRKPVMIAFVLVLIALLGAAAMVILLLLAEPEPEPEPEVDEVADVEEFRGVLVAVEGTPPGAVVFYEGTEMPLNPFPVDKKYTVSVVRIEAEGFTPVQVGVLPTEDRTVKVSMTPIGEKESDTAVAAAVVVDGISEEHREANRKHRAAKKTGKKKPPVQDPPKDDGSKAGEPPGDDGSKAGEPPKDDGSGGGETPNKTRVLTRQEIHEVMSPLVAAARRRCKTNDDWSVPLKVRVDGTGKVLGVSLLGGKPPTKVDKCVMRLARELKFPAYGGPPLGIEYPVALIAAEPEPGGGGPPELEPEPEPGNGDETGQIPESLSQQQIAAVMARVTRQARKACGKVPGGAVQVDFSVMGNGRVQNARAAGQFAGTPVGGCVVDAVRISKFPEFTDPRIDISYPIILGEPTTEEPPPEPKEEKPEPDRPEEPSKKQGDGGA